MYTYPHPTILFLLSRGDLNFNIWPGTPRHMSGNKGEVPQALITGSLTVVWRVHAIASSELAATRDDFMQVCCEPSV